METTRLSSYGCTTLWLDLDRDRGRQASGKWMIGLCGGSRLAAGIADQGKVEYHLEEASPKI